MPKSYGFADGAQRPVAPYPEESFDSDLMEEAKTATLLLASVIKAEPALARWIGQETGLDRAMTKRVRADGSWSD